MDLSWLVGVVIAVLTLIIAVPSAIVAIIQLKKRRKRSNKRRVIQAQPAPLILPLLSLPTRQVKLTQRKPSNSAVNPPAPSTSVKNDNSTPAFSKLTPREIQEYLDSLPPLQRDEAANNYKGIRVSWIVSLGLSSKRFDGSTSLFLHDRTEGPSYQTIVCEKVDIGKYPELKIIRENQEFRIEAEIENVQYGRIELINYKLYF